jgi:phage terminase large subunit GpA-like protein
MTEVVDLQPELERGLGLFTPRPEMRLSEWASANFYLSAESSYVEQPWTAYPYQVGIMDCMGNDVVEEVVLRKSARVGYTKMLLAAIAYFAEHKRRNQAIWQPTDEDSDEFVKTELEPMIRDVPAMMQIFPGYGMRSKDNTLRQKKFIGCVLHMRGGRAAKNYRRLSLSVAAIDEADAFDSDTEGEGSPVSLARKRLEGATFPKLIIGSTPKTKGMSLVDGREAAAALRLRFKIPCPCCGERIPLQFGGKNEPVGFKWTDDDPNTVKHLCEECGGLFDQSDYLSVWERGRWESEDGTYLDELGAFCKDGEPVPAPHSVAFFIWTAYSPQATWPQIVREWLSANRKKDKGDPSELKACINTTLGESWEEGGEAVRANKLQERAEAYELDTVPAGGVKLTMAVDVQGDRLEYLIKAWGVDEESWQVGYGVLPGDPAKPEVWADLRAIIARPLAHASGGELRVLACAIDSGGHHTHEVYQFCRANPLCFAVKGHSTRDKPIIAKPSTVDFNRKGEKIKGGARVYMLGVDTIKNLIFNRLRVSQPGPGYVHFSDELPDEYYEQLTAEKRVARYVKGHVFNEWTKAPGTRNEAWDLEVYATAAAHKLKFHTWKPRKWTAEAARIVPKVVIPQEIAEQVAEATKIRPAPRQRGGWVNRWKR